MDRGKVKIKARKYSGLNEELFAQDVRNFQQQIIFSYTEVDTAWDAFVRNFDSILDCHAPWRVMTHTDQVPDWCTKEFLSMCKEETMLRLDMSD